MYIDVLFKQASHCDITKVSLVVVTIHLPIQFIFFIGYLRGVEVYKETLLEVVGDKPQKLEWSGCGFYIEVPEGALPPDVTASVAIKVILAGQFELPKDSQLISAIYWISSSEVFLKEVAVNIQHCAAIASKEQCSVFKFVVARCSQEVLPYKFREKAGLFNVNTQYATIKVKHFSFFGIIGPWSAELHYMSLKFYRPIPSTKKVDYVFALVRNQNLHVEVYSCSSTHVFIVVHMHYSICIIVYSYFTFCTS